MRISYLYLRLPGLARAEAAIWKWGDCALRPTTAAVFAIEGTFRVRQGEIRTLYTCFMVDVCVIEGDLRYHTASANYIVGTVANDSCQDF